MKQVYITRTGSFLPNDPVENSKIEDVLGVVYEKDSHIKRLVLRRNGIINRHYALDSEMKMTHTNAELACEAIRAMFSEDFTVNDIDFLACATSVPDHVFPSQASMVHGQLGGKPIEIMSQSGVCLSSLQALKASYWAVAGDGKQAAVCSTSELVSPLLTAPNFVLEKNIADKLNKNPYMAFEKEFLRFMLSDGASAVLLQDHPAKEGVSFKIEWVDMVSYADKLPTCMLCGGQKDVEDNVYSWKCYTPAERAEKSIFAIKQDVRLLQDYAIEYFAESVKLFLTRHQVENVDFVLPHISSMFFYDKLQKALEKREVFIGQKGWYTNLRTTGNMGAASILTILDGFKRGQSYQKGDKVLLLVPESGRFSYGAVLLTIN